MKQSTVVEADGSQRRMKRSGAVRRSVDQELRPSALGAPHAPLATPMLALTPHLRRKQRRWRTGGGWPEVEETTTEREEDGARPNSNPNPSY